MHRTAAGVSRSNVAPAEACTRCCPMHRAPDSSRPQQDPAEACTRCCLMRHAPDSSQPQQEPSAGLSRSHVAPAEACSHCPIPAELDSGYCPFCGETDSGSCPIPRKSESSQAAFRFAGNRTVACTGCFPFCCETDSSLAIALPSFKAFRTNLTLQAKHSFPDPAPIPAYQLHLQAQPKKELDRLISAKQSQPSVKILGLLGIHVLLVYGLTRVLKMARQCISSSLPLAIEPFPILGVSLLKPDIALELVFGAALVANIELTLAIVTFVVPPPPAPLTLPHLITQNYSLLSRSVSFWTPDEIQWALE
ncbi:hypothetical protein PCANC_19758 [Puccinia coronata f. sp. avenae]|uniref:Uncharacterized protein n=1 Tax=Puccinia coronata f. sp. avenae TaxID=200324 RepID=A0A2N5UB68_9BASI|nr:hypothetical protein PCANC_19758 [Puccinia coronata f. sp. avenae]